MSTLPMNDTRFKTTAAVAETEASTVELANEVDTNAEQLHYVAGDAASAAQHKAPSSAVDELDNGINQAAAEGFHDVQSAKAAGAGYVAQAKNLAGSALSTAQSYLPNTNAQSNGTASGGLMSTLQSTASAAIATAGGLLSSAQTTLQPQTDAAKAAAQPHVDNARAAVQFQVDNARAAAQPHVDSAITFLGGTPATSKPNAVLPTTAPLEVGSHVGNSPYPAATNGQSAGIAEVRK